MSSKYSAHKHSTLFDSQVKPQLRTPVAGGSLRVPSTSLRKLSTPRLPTTPPDRGQRQEKPRSFAFELSGALDSYILYPQNNESFVNPKPLLALSKSTSKHPARTGGIYIPRIPNLFLPNNTPSTSSSSSAAAQHLDSLARVRQVPIVIPFAPSHGPCTIGIGVNDALRGIGLLNPETRLVDMIPVEFWALEREASVVIEWPGYRPRCTPIDILVDDHRGASYVTRSEFARQLAEMVLDFAETAATGENLYQPTAAREAGYTTCMALTREAESPAPAPVRRSYSLGGGQRGRGGGSGFGSGYRMDPPPRRAGIAVDRIRLLEAVSFDGRVFYLRLFVVE
ncbi:hypothetical protein MKEN_00464000 [Mycena kentingensis (nom. inval.)]|nr:hypothetical protein MKEN_00464000 [Mycena kentingensis (nom. inval.)]